MLQKRLGSGSDEGLDPDQTAGIAGTIRAAADATQLALPPHHDPKKEEEKISLFWRVFGGTILSIVALAAVTLFNNLTGTISELRNEVAREREARAELVKKDELGGLRVEVARLSEGRGDFLRKEEYTTRSTTMWDRIRAVEGLNPTVTGVKTEVDGLKERVAGLEAIKKELTALDVLKEKVTLVTADARAARDDAGAVKQEVERNRAADLERKSTRDTQHREVSEALKELQKGLQDCRERIARLEGGVPAPKTTPAKSASRPTGKVTPAGGTEPAPQPAPVPDPDE